MRFPSCVFSVFCVCIAALFPLLSTAFAQQTMVPLVFADYGFEITPLDGKPGSESQNVFQTFLPPHDGFSSNVNVQLQVWDKTIAEYIALTRKQFSEGGFTEISFDQRGDDECILEYRGSIGEWLLRFYARAVFRDGYVYLCTGTTQSQDWKRDGEVIRNCVESMKLRK